MSVHRYLAPLLLLACAQEPQALAPVPVAEPSPAPAAEVEDKWEREDAFLRQIQDLDIRLARLEILVEEMNNVGIGEAERVSWQPNKTTLAARNVQDALDELAQKLQDLERAKEDMGQAGAGLFDLENGPLGPRYDPVDQSQQDQARPENRGGRGGGGGGRGGGGRGGGGGRAGGGRGGGQGSQGDQGHGGQGGQ